VTGREEALDPTSCDVTAIVPCYNAGDRVLPVLKKLVGYAQTVIVVDDGSTDGGLTGADTLGVQLLRFDLNRGKGHALLAGLQAALALPGHGPIALLDADGQHDPAELPRLCQAFHDEKADLLIGARVFGGASVPWASRFGNRATIAITSWLVGRELPDTQCGYRLLSRAFAAAVVETVPGGRYETEMDMLLKAVQEDWQLAFVPVATLYEPGNQSSHFRKVQDSVRIYGRLGRALLRRR